MQSALRLVGVKVGAAGLGPRDAEMDQVPEAAAVQLSPLPASDRVGGGGIRGGHGCFDGGEPTPRRGGAVGGAAGGGAGGAGSDGAGGAAGGGMSVVSPMSSPATPGAVMAEIVVEVAGVTEPEAATPEVSVAPQGPACGEVGLQTGAIGLQTGVVGLQTSAAAAQAGEVPQGAEAAQAGDAMRDRAGSGAGETGLTAV
mmetsp:Transcript_26074/g.66120  ORF Transcript_26074/g.66120 Transcript_26074/m.66120 type:complete len:199 (-) Transcript_26074:185-781(-)